MSKLGGNILFGGNVAYLGFPLGLSFEMGVDANGQYVAAGQGTADIHLPF